MLGRKAKSQLRAFVGVAHQVRDGTATPSELLQASRTIAFDVYEPAIRAGRRNLRRLGQLVPPATEGAEYRDLLRSAAQLEEVHLAETRALEVEGYRTIHDLSHFRHTLRHRANRTIRRLGLTECVDKK